MAAWGRGSIPACSMGFSPSETRLEIFFTLTSFPAQIRDFKNLKGTWHKKELSWHYQKGIFGLPIPLLHVQITISKIHTTGFSSEIGTKLRDWAVGQAGGSCYSRAALSSNDSKTLYMPALI